VCSSDLHVFLPKLESVWFIYMNPYTPLYIHIMAGVEEVPAQIRWWITPVLLAWLGACCTAFAGLRIRSMRE
jgi:hypothetical protein